MRPRKLKMILFPLVWLLILGLGWVLWGTPSAYPGQVLAQVMPDLAVETYKVSGAFAPGNQVTYQIYFINQGSYVANNVRIVVTLPAATTYVTSSLPGFVLLQAGPHHVVLIRSYPFSLSLLERG